MAGRGGRPGRGRGSPRRGTHPGRPPRRLRGPAGYGGRPQRGRRQRAKRPVRRPRRAGLDVTVRDGETALLWDKLAFLAPFALLTTHAAAPVGPVREERRADLEAVVREVAEVATAAGAPVDPAGILGMFDAVPAGMK